MMHTWTASLRARGRAGCPEQRPPPSAVPALPRLRPALANDVLRAAGRLCIHCLPAKPLRGPAPQLLMRLPAAAVAKPLTKLHL